MSTESASEMSQLPDESDGRIAPSPGVEAAIAGGANVAVPASLDEDAHAEADEAAGDDANPV